MAAQKPRSGDGPLEILPGLKGAHKLFLPIQGGGRQVLELSTSELERLKRVVDRALEKH